MELEKSDVAVIDADGITNKRQYGIKDPAIVMQTLSGLYSNLQRIIVQEYISNARDAHREVGNDDIPVDVTLPTDLDPNLKIRDYGPGLSEERIGEVFCWFGESTKRVDNSQTGGFGIGAKCAFAYTESFMVETYIDGEMRRYVALKDDGETGLPSFNQMGNATKTNEKNGTCVIIPIESYDAYAIRSWVISTCSHWDVKPNVKNDTISWEEHEVIMEGDGWQLVSTENNRHYGLRGSPKVILDGIPYDVNSEIYEKNLDDEYSHVLHLNVLMFFKTGEVIPAVNRESLKVTDKTKKLICDRLREVYEKIKNDVTEKIKDATNLLEANLLWKNMNDSLGFQQIVKFINWNGFKVNGHGITCPGDSIVYSYKENEYDPNDRLKTNKGSILKFKENALYVVNDDNTMRPSPLRIRTIMETEDIDRLYVIQATPSEMSEWNDKGLSHIPYRKITEWEKKKRTPGIRGKSAITTCFECTSERSRWNSVNIDIANDDGVYVEYYRTGPLNHNSYDIYRISQMLGITVYGIPTRYMKKVAKNPGMIPFKTFVKGKLDELLTSLKMGNVDIESEISYLGDYGCVNWLHTNTPIYSYNFNKFLKTFKSFLDKNKLFGKWLRLSDIVSRWAQRDSTRKSQDTIDKINKLSKFLNVEPKLHNATSKSKLKEYAETFSTVWKDSNFTNIINWNNLQNLSSDDVEKLMPVLETIFNT